MLAKRDRGLPTAMGSERIGMTSNHHRDRLRVEESTAASAPLNQFPHQTTPIDSFQYRLIRFLRNSADPRVSVTFSSTDRVTSLLLS